LESEAIDAKVALIQELIPLGLLHVEEELQREVMVLAGPRYARQGGRPGVVRYGRQPGSIYLADQKLGIEVPRVRDLRCGQEVALATYQGLRQPRRADQGVLRRIVAGLSCRDYEQCAEAVPEAFGLSASTISRRFKRTSTKKLQELRERGLEGYDLVALVLDGKTFAEDTMVVALGITIMGEKVILGFVETGTENASVCTRFLRELEERGLRFTDGLLVVIDGGKGLYKAVKAVFEGRAFVQRCQWHKRENVLSYLTKAHQQSFRQKLQRAYAQPTYKQAKAALEQVRRELMLVNESAVGSLKEGLEETLTLHRFGVFRELGLSLKTTNCLESINSLVEQRTGKVDCWRNSNQKQRWLATALLNIEPRLRKIKGYHYLPMLRRAMQEEMRSTIRAVA
jgi:transposase-like protein